MCRLRGRPNNAFVRATGGVVAVIFSDFTAALARAGRRGEGCPAHPHIPKPQDRCHAALHQRAVHGPVTPPLWNPPPPQEGAAGNKERALHMRDPQSGGAYMGDGRGNAWRSRAPGPHTHGNASEAGYGRPEDGGAGAAKTFKRPPQQPAQPPVRRLLGAADVRTAHPSTSCTAPAHQRLGSANAETTPAGAPARRSMRREER